MKSAAFLVDSGPGIGLGHLRRSLVLLDAMTDAGFTCRLYTASTDAATALGRTASIPPASLGDLPPTDVVVCDSYVMDQQQLALLRGRRTILLVFDDMGDRPIDADIVLNHNLYGATIDYSRLTRATVLRGPECTLIDRRILEARVAHESNVGTGIVISFGGTDDGTRAAELARHLLPEFAGPIHIVVAPGVAPSPDVRKLTAKMPDRVILQHGPDMPPLLAGARLYLGGAGMTALEALVIGLDMVLCVISDNQRLNAEAFGRFGHAVVQGLEPKEAAAIAVSLLRKPYSPRSSPVDGRGGARVVAAIEQLLASKRKD